MSRFSTSEQDERFIKAFESLTESLKEVLERHPLTGFGHLPLPMESAEFPMLSPLDTKALLAKIKATAEASLDMLRYGIPMPAHPGEPSSAAAEAEKLTKEITRAAGEFALGTPTHDASGKPEWKP